MTNLLTQGFMMPSSLLLHELTREEARAIAPDTLIVFPTGATEQHGPHLPVATDCMAVEHIAREAARHSAQSIPVIVAPTQPFGSSHHHLPYCGTMTLSTEVYYKLVFELCESLVSGGFQRIFIVNGHGGNNELVQLVARDLALKYPVQVAAASYWVAAWDALCAAKGDDPGRLPGHAGAFETSLVMALRPDLVREPRPHRDNPRGSAVNDGMASVRIERSGYWQAIEGYSDSPDLADAEKGRRYLAAAVDAVAKSLQDFYRSTLT
jgi:creatinine amidohydrolase